MIIEHGPHKAIIKITLDAHPIQKDGELCPMPSHKDEYIVETVYGKNLSECLKNAEGKMEKWKEILKTNN